MVVISGRGAEGVVVGLGAGVGAPKYWGTDCGGGSLRVGVVGMVAPMGTLL